MKNVKFWDVRIVVMLNWLVLFLFGNFDNGLLFVICLWRIGNK